MSARTRLYLITPPQISDLAAFESDFAGALDAGDIACVQLRLKSPDGIAAPDDDILAAAERLLPLAKERDVAFLINDRPDLTAKAGADGVHIGQSDASYTEARALLGDDATVGVTCHNSIHLGLEAGEAGADYVAFGAFFPTDTKKTEHKAEPELLAWWRHATIVPSVAIGGISPQNCAPLIHAGADFLAVSSAVWRNPAGPAEAVKALNVVIDKESAD